MKYTFFLQTIGELLAHRVNTIGHQLDFDEPGDNSANQKFKGKNAAKITSIKAAKIQIIIDVLPLLSQAFSSKHLCHNACTVNGRVGVHGAKIIRDAVTAERSKRGSAFRAHTE